MADRGIIFSAPMVRALLDGRKTQTRRLLKPAPPKGLDGGYLLVDGEDRPRVTHGRVLLKEHLPYAPGDRLYVREAAQQVAEGYLTIYRADYPACVPAHFENVPTLEELKSPWRPSIHMPRAWSRLWLLVTEVRVQRVAEISGHDAVEEGVSSRLPDNGVAQAEFQDLWNSLHTKPGERWEDNPWIVAVTFDVRHGNIDRSST